MRYDEIEEWSVAAAKWSANYFGSLRDLPVRSQVKPGEIAAKIAPSPPETAESMAAIFDDFKSIIPPGITHWQHPRFFAYFPSNAAPASIFAEQLVSSIAAQCMLWQTSPAATELEIMMIDWLRQALGLPEALAGVIHDSATSATLSAILTMREKTLRWRGNQEGLMGCPPLRIYASSQNHSSIEKAVRIAGIGENNLVKIPADATWAMRPELLSEAISKDRALGFIPAGVIGCIGGTSIGAFDRLREILSIAKEQQLTSHVDAAWAGSAMICPEFRYLWDGIELADSIVVNPHKWLGANFDCSVQFLRQPQDQIKTLAIRPHYLQSLDQTPGTHLKPTELQSFQDSIADSQKEDLHGVLHPPNFSEWTIPLGRRFRALKLWFVFRAYGIEGLRSKIRSHVAWASQAATRIAEIPHIEIVTQPRLSLFTFRLTPPGKDPDLATQALLETINADGRIYLTQTTHDGKFVIRFSIGQFSTTWDDIETAINVIQQFSLETAL